MNLVLNTAIWDLKIFGSQKAYLKEYSHKISREITNYLPFEEEKILPHVFETPMHLWDKKLQHRNPLNNIC